MVRKAFYKVDLYAIIYMTGPTRIPQDYPTSECLSAQNGSTIHFMTVMNYSVYFSLKDVKKSCQQLPKWPKVAVVTILVLCCSFALGRTIKVALGNDS